MSGIAAMSGEFGVWPMSPAAKPANPAPSVRRSSKCDAGTSFAFGLPCMSTNCANRNSMPFAGMYSRASSTDSGGVNGAPPFIETWSSAAMRSPPLGFRTRAAGAGARQRTGCRRQVYRLARWPGNGRADHVLPPGGVERHHSSLHRGYQTLYKLDSAEGLVYFRTLVSRSDGGGGVVWPNSQA